MVLSPQLRTRPARDARRSLDLPLDSSRSFPRQASNSSTLPLGMSTTAPAGDAAPPAPVVVPAMVKNIERLALATVDPPPCSPAVSAFRGVVPSAAPAPDAHLAPRSPDADEPRPRGRLASMASRLQDQLAEFAGDLARQDALLLEGQDECARLDDEQRRVNEDFGVSVVRILGEQRDLVERGKARMETQTHALRAVAEERDDLLAEKRTLAASVADATASLAEKETALEAAAEARAALERELRSKDAQLSQTESELRAVHDENARLASKLENTTAEISHAEGRRGALMERNDDLQASLRAAEEAREAAEEHIARRTRANAALEDEISRGEDAVRALQEQTSASFASLRSDREALIARNEALREQMAASQAKLDDVRAEAESIVAEEHARNEALERKHEETLRELRDAGGDAALAPMLMEAQRQLAEERERVARLAEEKAALETTANAGARAAREREGKLELLDRSLADFERNRVESAAALGPGFQDLDASTDAGSVAGFSDIASVMSEMPGNPNDPAAAARRAKAKENKIKFENVKRQRDSYKQGLRAAKEEIERMRKEVGMVEELKKQVESLRENMYV